MQQAMAEAAWAVGGSGSNAKTLSSIKILLNSVYNM